MVTINNEIMYNANVYQIMIGAPSDIKEEIQMACETINRWNALNSEQHKIVLLPLHWSINSYPSVGNRPQHFLNRQLVEKSDLLICIFGTRIGTPTGKDVSGTVEEFKEHVKAGKNVMMFFKNTADNVSSLDPRQLQQLNEFKQSIKDTVLWWDYQKAADFKDLLFGKLQLYINDNWLSEQQLKDNVSKTITDSLTDFDKERLAKWSEGDGEVWISDTMDGRTILIGESEYAVSNGKERAEWDDFFHRMCNIDYAQIDRYDNDGNPVYTLTKKGYDYIGQLTSL